MGSLLGDWPSYNPHNFSQLRPADASAQPSNAAPVTYLATHRTDPPPNQVKKSQGKEFLLDWAGMYGLCSHLGYHRSKFATMIANGIEFFLSNVITTESRNILLRQFYQKSEEKLRPKRAAPENFTPQHSCKQQRGPIADGGS